MVDESAGQRMQSGSKLPLDYRRGIEKSVSEADKPPRARQGRPAMNDGMNGRDQLLEKTREMIRAKPKADIQRREIADYANVTPALVSYYFPDKWDLIEASAAPVIDSYFSAVLKLTESSEPDLRDLRALIKIYVKFSFEEGYLLEFYLENIDSWKNFERLRHTTKVYNAILNFLSNLMLAGHIRPHDPATLNSVLWASSHYLTLQYKASPLSFNSGSSPNTDYIAESLMQILFSGLLS